MIVPSDMITILQLRQVDNYLAEIANVFNLLEADIPRTQVDRMLMRCEQVRDEVTELIDALGEEMDKKFLEDLYEQ